MEENSLVVGIDIGSTTHYARAFDWRGIELARIFKFGNSGEGFGRLSHWMQGICERNGKTKIIVGIEPTGHYWFTLGRYLREQGVRLVMVNPYAVKQNDGKDPKVIAKLVLDGRYSIPYVPTGAYADLRILSADRQRIVKEIGQIKNRFARWFAIYFPEYCEVFGSYESKSSMLLLRVASTPESIVALGVEGICRVWREAKIRAVGTKRATTLYETAQRSIGHDQGTSAAKLEMALLLEDYEAKAKQLAFVMAALESTLRKIPEAEKLLAIRGIGIISVAGFLAEVGDLRRFESPKQIKKLAGLSLRENSSGKHKGQTTISRRGRDKLRQVLFNAVIPLLATNEEFRSLHQYFTTRTVNPLKKKQSAIALCGKLIRVFYAIMVHGVEYDGKKMLADIQRKEPMTA